MKLLKSKYTKYISCLVVATIFFTFALIGGTFGVTMLAINLGGETGSSSGGATVGAIVPNTVTEMKVKGKTIKIPTTKGKSGAEESIEALHAKGQGLALESYCNKAESQYYINMRWPYAKWAWNGHSTTAEQTSSLFGGKKVVIYNPRTKKTVVAAICESGPAPWTGSGISSGNPPSYWRGFLQFDPPEYTAKFVGRVSGLSPAPWHDIGAKEDDILEYGFAADQNIPLGPVK